jgi:enterochelin esterase-like enzyme
MPAETLLARARREGTPLLEASSATFVWAGASPPELVGDFNEWGAQPGPTPRREGPRLWSWTLELPPDAYIEYQFRRGSRWLHDPLNARLLPREFGRRPQWFYMPQGGRTPVARRPPGGLRGRLVWDTLDEPLWLAGRGPRAVGFYQPDTAAPCPLLVVFDGRDYARRASLVTVVDNLIADNRIQPVALALVHNAGANRVVEYACAESTVAFVLERLLPEAKTRLALADENRLPGVHGIMGASMGGLMALHTALRAPQVFGHVLSQSGAFSVFGFDFGLYDWVAHLPLRPVRVWLDVGRYEGFVAANQRMHHVLIERGYDAAYREHNAGHNYPAWRNVLPEALGHLFGELAAANPQTSK